MPTSQPHSSTSKHSWKKINVPFPEKSELFWRRCGFHLTNGQIFTTRGGPGKRELRLNLFVIISRALATAVFLRRPLSVRGCKHNLAIRCCAGNVDAHATAARLLMLTQEVFTADSLGHRVTADLCFLLSKYVSPALLLCCLVHETRMNTLELQRGSVFQSHSSTSQEPNT